MSLPPLLSWREVQVRLRVIFPEGTPERWHDGSTASRKLAALL